MATASSLGSARDSTSAYSAATSSGRESTRASSSARSHSALTCGRSRAARAAVASASSTLPRSRCRSLRRSNHRWRAWTSSGSGRESGFEWGPSSSSSDRRRASLSAACRARASLAGIGASMRCVRISSRAAVSSAASHACSSRTIVSARVARWASSCIASARAAGSPGASASTARRADSASPHRVVFASSTCAIFEIDRDPGRPLRPIAARAERRQRVLRVSRGEREPRDRRERLVAAVVLGIDGQHALVQRERPRGVVECPLFGGGPVEEPRDRALLRARAPCATRGATAGPRAAAATPDRGR